MKVNYLHMIWDVKIYLAKIKDCKGKDLYFSAKKNLLTITSPKYHKVVISRTDWILYFAENSGNELEKDCSRVFYFYPWQ